MNATARKVKLVRVSDGLYRSESGAVHVFLDGRNHDGGKWLVRWSDVFSVRHERRFATLAAVRVYLNS